jgi:two-component system sensor histidine kinase/response regulator
MADSLLILVVDDSPLQRKIYSAALKADGYEVIVAENGREAVEMALQYYPALILMDVSMPEMDGLAAAYELRQHRQMDSVPILALTAIADPAEVEEAQQAGYNDVVDKNADRAVMLEIIRAWLSG